MTKKLISWPTSENLENRLFLVALVFACPYFISSIIFDFVNNAAIQYFVLDGMLLAICILFFFLSPNPKLLPVLIIAFSFLIIGGFIFYWFTTNGIIGGGAYIFPMISVLIILINRKNFRRIFTGLMIVLVFLITTDVFEISGVVTYKGLLFDYLLNMVMLSIILIVFKVALDKERSDIEQQNHKIQDLNEALSKKTQELESYNTEIRVLKQNLENIVKQRTKKLEEENQRDIEFAFINAHLVRAPIANIIGLSEILNEDQTKFKELKKNVYKLDDIVRKIGSVLTKTK